VEHHHHHHHHHHQNQLNQIVYNLTWCTSSNHDVAVLWVYTSSSSGQCKIK
jgi:hypothetical protein